MSLDHGDPSEQKYFGFGELGNSVMYSLCGVEVIAGFLPGALAEPCAGGPGGAGGGGCSSAAGLVSGASSSWPIHRVCVCVCVADVQRNWHTPGHGQTQYACSVWCQLNDMHY